MPRVARHCADWRWQCERLEERRLLTIVFGSAPSTTVSDNNGPIISHPQVELVFWGPAWGGAPSTLSGQIAADYSAILTSGYLDGLDEYRATFGPGALFGQAFISDNTPPASFTNSNVDSMLRSEIAAGALPQPTTASNLYYFVVPTSGTSSPGLAGEHTYDFSSGHVFHYGWTVNSSNNLDSLTKVFSHELAEAASDPEGNAVQVNPRNPTSWNEICDGAPASFDYRLDGVQVQSYVSAQYHGYIVPTGQRQDFFLSAVGGTLTVKGDQLASPDDTITIDKTSTGGVSVTLNGETAAFDSGQVGSITVNSGAGNDTVNILAAPVAVTVNSSSAPDGPSDVVNLGKAGLTSGLTGRITIGNSTGLDTLNIDDSADPMTHSVTLSSTGSQGMIVNLTPGSVFYTSNQLDALNIRASSVPSLFSIRSLGVPTNITAGGPENVFIGNSGSVQAVAAPLNLDDTKPQMSVTLDDSADSSPRNIALSTSMSGAWQDISGLAPATIRYNGAALNPAQRVIINGGTAGNTFAINGLSSSSTSPAALTLNAGSGDDAVTLSASAAGMPLTINGQGGDDTFSEDFSGGNIQPGTVTFDGGDGTNFLTVRGAGATDSFSLPAAGQVAHATALISYTNIANLTLDSGSFDITDDLGPISLGSVGAGTTLSLDGTQNLSSLDIAAGTRCILTHSATAGAASLNLNALTVAGTLDLANNALQLTYGSNADPIAAIRSLIASGYDSGAWDGTGINTSDADAAHGLGFADAADGAVASLPAGTIIMKWARYGDVNLDGSVDFADLLALAQHYGQPAANWDQGDFNYDQSVSFADLLALAQHYGTADSTAVVASPVGRIIGRLRLARAIRS